MPQNLKLLADTADHSETVAESEVADTEASSENVTATEVAADISDTTVAGWQFVVEKLEKNKSLENVSVDLGYTGVETNDYVKEASDGNVYYLIKMQINKDGKHGSYRLGFPETDRQRWK